MRIIENDQILREFPVSTSKFGLGDQFNSYRTPLGMFEVAQRIGHNVPIGGIFYRRTFTGKAYDLNDPRIERLSRDSILSRIIWLRGLEEKNRNAYLRGIYIHGTNQESLVGRPVSYGCIRMKNHDVIEAFDLLPEGTRIVIQTDPFPKKQHPRKKNKQKHPVLPPEPPPAPPPIVPANAKLVASASDPNAPEPTILRSTLLTTHSTDTAPNPTNTPSPTSTTPTPSPHTANTPAKTVNSTRVNKTTSNANNHNKKTIPTQQPHTSTTAPTSQRTPSQQPT